MGSYLNTGFEKFEESLNARLYVDKSELISVLNDYVETEQRFFCISRPRRFGKTVTANMLCAYYSKNTDSSFLFDNLKISHDDSYKTHLNQYNTLFLNITDEFNRAEQNVKTMIKRITDFVSGEIKEAYPEIKLLDQYDLSLTLESMYSQTKKGFVIVIDEWDCIMRERKTDAEGIKTYLEWLKLLMKDKAYVALAYMTGILPIKKCGTHSSLNMFDEYSMTDPGEYASYIGFTENEVLSLCEEYKVDFGLMKKWYDGYSFENSPHLYNPNSVVCAIDEWYVENGNKFNGRNFQTLGTSK